MAGKNFVSFGNYTKKYIKNKLSKAKASKATLETEGNDDLKAFMDDIKSRALNVDTQIQYLNILHKIAASDAPILDEKILQNVFNFVLFNNKCKKSFNLYSQNRPYSLQKKIILVYVAQL